MKKEIYFFYSSLPGAMLGVLLDQAKKAMIDEGKKVYFVMCEGFFSHCLSNPKGNIGICKLCKSQSRKIIFENLSKDITFLQLSDYYKGSHKKEDIILKKAQDVKKYVYKDIEIGYGVISSYIHLTRNQLPEINNDSIKYFQNQILQSKQLIDAFENVIDDIKPDEISSFNGRFNEIKPVFELGIKKNIQVNLYEFENIGYKKYAKVVFKNTLPHSIKGNRWKFDYLWNDPNLLKSKKIELAKEFYYNKRNGIAAGDKIYVKGTTTGKLPNNWDEKKKNIILFNSSEDEYVSIGKEWEDLALFESQYEGLKYIFNQHKDNNEIHFYLRVHPNLKNVKYKYHTKLYNFQEDYNNVTVISPSEDINSYDLLDVSDKVIIFGSTIGLEASYWGKPVILLGCSWYYYENVCYIPKSLEELNDLLTKDLQPIKNEENFLKLGLFFYHRNATYIDRETIFKYVDFNITICTIFGNEIFGYNYQKLLGSIKLKAIVVAIIKLLSLYLTSNKYKLPINEE
ncbi:hypothetical protein [Polaribacter sp. MED152]|uniref:capsular polysaccharide export protein, LipB/KpsS family n=1 Tax=Polaribacter sp. MED152 TaxID=313598 RepID=UPI000068CCBE|nr:hypothetical protein [Polaribacter sp. MED152]EAQ42178.1 hypothetical protein MED152_05650 [Polaribacter sp. MED152]